MPEIIVLVKGKSGQLAGSGAEARARQRLGGILWRADSGEWRAGGSLKGHFKPISPWGPVPRAGRI